jgi:phosphoglycolate phosphatase-like HAD superfamily hydrolase
MRIEITFVEIIMKLLISDLEGTLVDFQWKLKESMDEMCKIIKGYNINYNLNLPVLKLKKMNYSKLYNYFQKNIDDPKLKRKIMADFNRIYDFYDKDASKRWKLKSNVNYVFAKLTDMDVKIALCSNVGRNALDYIIYKFKIKSFFDITVSRNDVDFLKPNIDGLKKIFKFFNVKNSNENSIFFLGDSLTDIYTARKAKISSIIIVGEGENSLSEILEHKPNHIINNLKDVLEFYS